MAVYLTEEMLVDPALAVPRMSPVSVLKPDWSHTALQDKYMPSVLAVANGSNRFVNLLNNAIAVKSGGPTRAGSFITFDGSDDHIDLKMRHAYNDSNRKGFTFLFIQRRGNLIASAGHRIFRVGGNGSGIAIWADSGGPLWSFDSQVATGSGSTARNTTGVVLGAGREVWAVTSTGTSGTPTVQMVPWRNGKKLSYNSTQTFPNDSGGNADDIRVAARLNASTHTRIDIEFIAIWFKKLPDSLVRDLSLDPYQIVMPA